MGLGRISLSFLRLRSSRRKDSSSVVRLPLVCVRMLSARANEQSFTRSAVICFRRHSSCTVSAEMTATPMWHLTACLMACVLPSSSRMFRSWWLKPLRARASSITLRVPEPCSRVMSVSDASSLKLMDWLALHGWSLGTTTTSSSCQNVSTVKFGSSGTGPSMRATCSRLSMISRASISVSAICTSMSASCSFV